MEGNLPDGDSKEIWRNQTTEPSTMTLEFIRRKARELHEKTRRELFANVSVALFAVALSGVAIARTDRLDLRFVAISAIVWALAGQYFIHRGMWSAMPAGDAAVSTGLEFYRREIERRSQLFGSVLKWSFGPVILSIAAMILPIVMMAMNRGLLARTIPFFSLLAIWVGAMFVMRWRGHRELRREIAELDDIERQNK